MKENPFDSTKPGFCALAGIAFAKFLMWFAILLAVFLISSAVYQSAKAHEHGKEFWMSDSFYKTKSGGHCCGPEDCKPTDMSNIIETEDGFIVSDPRAPETRFFSKAKDYKEGLYFSEDLDNRPFVCVYQNVIVCVAVPRRAYH